MAPGVLGELMTRAGFTSVAGFCRAAGIGRRTAARLRSGEVDAVPYRTLERVARSLGLDTPEFIEHFVPGGASTAWRSEYERLQAKLDNLQVELRERWDLEFFHKVELLLVQLPSVRAAALTRPDLGAQTVIDLLLPLDEFLGDAGFVAIGTPGEEVPFDPAQHQGTGIAPGDLVRIKTVGYRYGERLLVRARVAPVR